MNMKQNTVQLSVEATPGDPLVLMKEWADHILSIDALEPMYVTLATASRNGVPSSRMVQLLDIEPDCLLFTTNMGSRKGMEMIATGCAAVSVYWRETAQSINVTGTIQQATTEENDRRFAHEDRAIQAARVASFQGRPVDDEGAYLAKFEEILNRDTIIERPDYWRWFRLFPNAVTFWKGYPKALNRRLHYQMTDAGWTHGLIQA